MSHQDTANRFNGLRNVLLAACSIIVVLFGFGVWADVQFLRYTSLAALLVTGILLVYISLVKFRRSVLAALSFVVSLFVVEFVFAGMEIRSGYLDEQRGNDSGGKQVLSLHPDLVYWLKPEVEGRVSRRFGDLIAYENVPFHTDQLGRRICPLKTSPEAEHAIFFGGSFTFGQGVTDEEAMPCVFQRVAAGRFRSYNYGNNGYGTGQMYWLLKNGDFFEPEMPDEGIAVYNFIGDHVSRTVGELGKLTYESLPWMEFYLFKTNPVNGDLVSYHLSDNPAVHRFLKSVQTFRLLSPAARYVFSRIDIPLAPAEEGVRIVAEVIIQSKRLYDARFTGDFYVLLWPRVGLEPVLEGKLIGILKADGIRVIDVPEMPGDVPAQIHPRDAHPSVAEYRWVAEYLYEIIAAGDS